MPIVTAAHVVVTPCFAFSIITNVFEINKRQLLKWWVILLTALFYLLLYAFVPIILLVLTLPVIFIYTVKKGAELRDLIRNRFVFYR